MNLHPLGPARLQSFEAAVAMPGPGNIQAATKSNVRFEMSAAARSVIGRRSMPA